MARNQEPVSDEALAALREEMEGQREEIREALAEDLGGDPEDYDVSNYFDGRTGETAADGGE